MLDHIYGVQFTNTLAGPTLYAFALVYEMTFLLFSTNRILSTGINAELTPPVKLLVTFTEAAHVNVIVIDLCVMSHFVLDKVTLFQGIHATHTRAIFMIVLIPTTDTVDNGHALGGSCKLSVFAPHEDLPVGGCGRIVKALELQTGRDVWVFTVTKLLHGGRIHEVITCSHDDGFSPVSSNHTGGISGPHHGPPSL